MAKFCTSCGSQMDDTQTTCPNCGAIQQEMQQQVPQNDTNVNENNMQQQAPIQDNVNNMQQMQTQNNMNNNQQATPSTNPEAKSKIVAGILGILFGSIGIHNFYLGNTKRGIIQIIVTLFTFGLGGIWGFVEGILILVGNISTDANGVPLKD